MKKSVILGTLLLLASCNMDEKLYTYIDEATYITDAASARNVLYGVYREMGTNQLYGYYLSIIYDLPTDIAKVDGNSITNNRDICVNAHTPDHAWVQGTWSQAYKVIFLANDFMEKASAAQPSMKQSDREIVSVYIAEAKAIRALMYFELVRLFGGVSLMTDTASSNNPPETFRRESAETIYKFVEKELLEASEVLPWATEDTLRSQNAFMFSKAGALGILARAYVTWAGYPTQDSSKWAEAEKVCKQIIRSGRHGLLTDYETLWRNVCNGVWDPTESLMEISFFSPTIASSGSQNNSGYIGKWNGVYVVTNSSNLVRVDARYRALPTFIGSWKDYDKDRRWGLSAVDYSYDGLTKVPMCTYHNQPIPFSESLLPSAISYYRSPYKNGLYVAKYDLTKYVSPDKQLKDGNYSNAHWYLLRYSDVLLMYAEAVNESKGAPTDSAIAAVNMVRRRGWGKYASSGESPLSVTELPANADSLDVDIQPGIGQEEFRRIVRDERKYELCFEGQRRQDLVRWGIYYETVVKTGEDLENWCERFEEYYLGARYTIKGRHEIYPIPQRELDLMKQYTQNPGWE